MGGRQGWRAWMGKLKEEWGMQTTLTEAKTESQLFCNNFGTKFCSNPNLPPASYMIPLKTQFPQL